MLHIICALKPEAAPLLTHFELQPAAGPARIYSNPDTGISLTLSGIGASTAAEAVARTRARFNADKTHAWLNLGIAGHAELPLGQAVFVNKVTDAASGRTWFPSRVFPITIPSCGLITLQQPDSNYGKELFDMECAGFFQAAGGGATLELVQALKIVSDNAEQPMNEVNPALISRLLRQNLPVIEEIAGQLLALSALQQRLQDPGTDYHALTRRLRFSVSQQHQLQGLLRKWQTLHPDDAGLAGRLRQKKTAAEVLRHLREALDRTPIRLDNHAVDLSADDAD